MSGSLATAFVLSLYANVGNGLEEELADRAYMLRNAAEGFRTSRIGVRTAVVFAWALTSVNFGLAHMGRSAPASAIVLLMLVGALFALPYVLTGQLGVSIGIHTTWNFAQTSLFGLADGRSGTQGTLIAVQQRPGAAFWVGDASWGPESGALCVLVCLVGAVVIAGWVRVTRGARSIAERSFEAPAVAAR